MFLSPTRTPTHIPIGLHLDAKGVAYYLEDCSSAESARLLCLLMG